MVTTGTRFGPYEVVSPIGAGGMGEVYKATDTRLDRSVAIKILPAEFAADAHLRARFEREARAISQLTHPNICTLYDVGDGYLVMELLDGETLAERIARGPMPLDQIVRVGTDIAHALDRAHKAGVIHRDLKPSNVMLTRSGAKLLDFGLAKDTALATPLHDPEAPTASYRPAITEEGTLLGTVQYMAPEQVEGVPADARTDIFALGAVLYEMATGRRAFEGKSKASVIAAILAVDPPPLTALQPTSTPSLERLIRTCLAKEPDERWQSAKDVAHGLQSIVEAAPPASHRPGNSIAWSVAALLAVVTAVAGWTAWRAQRTVHDHPPLRTMVLPPERMEFDLVGVAGPPALSPDGMRIVFGAKNDKGRTLWVRSLDSIAPQQLANTEGASYPFWSPDGRSIGFFADGELRRIDAAGGTPVTICRVTNARGGTWSPDGHTIVYGSQVSGLFRVGARGGQPVEFTRTNASFGTNRWPQFLPDGKHVLYLAARIGYEDPGNTIFAATLDGKEQKALLANANEPHYFDGALLFTRNRVLMAQRFDPETLQLAGDPVPLGELEIDSAPVFAQSILTMASGTLVYQPGAAVENTRLLWSDRNGKVLGTVDQELPHIQIKLSPDGKTVALSYRGNPQANIWAFDLERQTKRRLTFGGGMDRAPVWSPDGRRILYSSVAPGHTGLFIKDLVTGSEEQVLAETGAIRMPQPTSWSPDGRTILLMGGGATSHLDIFWMSLAERKPHPLVASDSLEAAPNFSPDGKWVAYQSNETGRYELYLMPFPPTGVKWQISSDGGSVAHWRGDGKEIFYITERTRLMAVPVTLGPTPTFGRPAFLFDGRLTILNPGVYDVTPNGQRFLVNSRIGEDAPPAPLVVVQYFDGILKAALEQKQ